MVRTQFEPPGFPPTFIMKKITEQYFTEQDLKTKDQKLFESFVAESGLPVEAARALYEQKGFASLNEDADSKFENYKPILERTLTEFTKLMTKASKEAVSAMILEYVNSKSSNSTTNELLKTVLLVLIGKDDTPEKKVDSKLRDFAEEYVDYEELYESFTEGNTDTFIIPKFNVPGFDIDRNIEDDIKLYSGLRDVLVKNNMLDSSNNNIEIRSTFKAIVNYLDNEIDYLANKQNVHIVDASHIEVIVRELLENRLSPQYKDIKIMRELVDNVQLLVFECVQVVATYMAQNKNIARYVSVTKINNFADSYNLVLEMLWSVREQSIVQKLYEINNVVNDEETRSHSDVAGVVKFSNVMEINYQSVQDACFLIKNCMADFSMKSRQVLNNFITNSLSFAERIYNIKQLMQSKSIQPTFEIKSN